MKTLFNISVLALFLMATSTCFALRSIGFVTKAEAKEMGIKLEANGSGPDQVWVELEFKAEGKLKTYQHVELEINEGDKMLVAYAALQDRKSDKGVITVRFLTVRSFLDKLTLTIVTGEIDSIGHMLRVKDFVEAKK